MCRANIYDARNNFSSLVRLAESGEPVELTRHDKPVAVIISWEEYEQRKPKKTFIQKLMEIREKYKDVLEDPTFNGLEIPDDGYPDEEYDRKVAEMWGEE